MPCVCLLHYLIPTVYGVFFQYPRALDPTGIFLNTFLTTTVLDGSNLGTITFVSESNICVVRSGRLLRRDFPTSPRDVRRLSRGTTGSRAEPNV